MNYFEKKVNGFKKRIRCIKYGMFYFKNSAFKIPDTLLINGEKKKLQLKNVNMHEFTAICINDCYHLHYLKRKIKKVRSIVDIGANQGMFMIAARQHFPSAYITGYEPNEQLKEALRFNAQQLNASVYYEAVMKNDCMVALNFTESDLATTVSESEYGSVRGTSLKKVIERIGSIDILKLDCEGAEWELLEDSNSWKNIRSIALEYHLSNREYDHMNIKIIILNLGFEIFNHTILSPEQGLIIAINKKF